MAIATLPRGRNPMTPCIAVPVSVLQNIEHLLETSGENTKAQAHQIVKGILDEHLKSIESEVVVK